MEFFHVLNRGVDKRAVVVDDGDRLRFVRSLFVYNDSKPAPNFTSQSTQWEDWKRTRDLLVYIHAWCLMDNHYHLLLSPVNDDMSLLTKFMRKLNMGYAKFFNEKHDRSGYLWQGRFKRVHIETDAHFHYVPYYIHLNPLDFSHKEWRTGGVKSTLEAIDMLQDYRWSSYLDYTNKRNFPSVIYKDALTETLGNAEAQMEEIVSIIQDSSKTADADSFET